MAAALSPPALNCIFAPPTNFALESLDLPGARAWCLPQDPRKDEQFGWIYRRRVLMNRIKVWPHVTIVVMVVALIAGVGTWFYLRHEQTAEAEALPYAARIQRVDGQVAFCDDRANTDANA